MDYYINKAIELRKILHTLAEESMKETKTKQTLLEFVEKETDLEVFDMGNWFYAKYSVDNASRTIAYRADFDAVTGEDGISRHLCGHDGHAANLAVFAKWISDNKPNNNILLIFQHAEEIGVGGKECSEILKREEVDEIYGFHNIPTYNLGDILILEKTFACASVGLEIKLIGSPAHAAYPETGINPGLAVANIITDINDYLNQEHDGIVQSTVIGIESGSKHFGVSASEGTLRLTLRAEYSNEFDALISFVKNKVDFISKKYLLKYQIEEYDYFPATENHGKYIQKVTDCAQNIGLKITHPKEPFRWSEDFGWYLQKVPGAFFGIGCGCDHPQLHTATYKYNDALYRYSLNIFAELCK